MVETGHDSDAILISMSIIFVKCYQSPAVSKKMTAAEALCQQVRHAVKVELNENF
jgi:hypothetical protein